MAQRDPVSSLIGRDADIAAVLDALRSPGAECCTVTGMGGVGKTALARHVREVLLRDDHVLVPWVSLGPVGHPSVMVPAMATAMGAPPGPALDAVVAHLGGAAVVLVLDGVEHLLPDAAVVVAALVERVPTLRVLATSQVPLRLAGERLVSLAPLPVPAVDDPGTARRSPAVQLYLARAAQVDRVVVADADTLSAVAALCRALDGLPLAIELAAARAATLPPAVALAEISRAPLDVLRVPLADRPARHHDLRSAVAWSVGLLADGPRGLLECLSVARGPVDLSMVEVLQAARADGVRVRPGVALDHLAALVDAHLVRRSQRTDRPAYDLPTSVRAYAAQLLVASGDEAVVRRAYLHAVARSVGAEMWSVDGPDAVAAARRLHPLVDEGLVCLEEAVTGRDVAAAMELVAGLCSWWSIEGYRDAHWAVVDRAFDLVDDDAAAAPVVPTALAMAHIASWSLQQRLEPGEPAQRHWRRMAEAEHLARTSGDDRLLAVVLACRVAATALGDRRSGAPAAVAEGQALAAALGDDHLLATFDVQAAMLAHMGGAAAAWELAVRGLVRGRSSGNASAVVLATMVVRPLATTLDRALPAEVPDIAEALAIARAAGLAGEVPLLEAMLATEEAARVAGDPTAAERAVRLALDALGHPVAVVTVQWVGVLAAASVLAAVGDAESAVWVHHVVAPVLPVLAAAIPPSMRAGYERDLATAREQVDDARLRLRAEGLSAAQGVAVAVGALRRWQQGNPRPGASPFLTDRQSEVLMLLASGLSNREISARLGCATKTVTHHLSAIYDRLGVRTRSEAVAWAFRHGFTGDRLH